MQHPPAPVARIQHYQVNAERTSSCSPPQIGSCVTFTDGSLPVEAMHFVAGSDGGPFDPYSYLYRGYFYTDLAGIMQHTPYDCARLKARAPNGVMSDPTVLCRNDGSLTMLTGSDNVVCTSRGIEHDGVVIAPDVSSTSNDSGSRSSCTMSSGRRHDGCASGVLLALALGGWVRGRDRRLRKRQRSLSMGPS